MVIVFYLVFLRVCSAGVFKLPYLSITKEEVYSKDYLRMIFFF